MSEAGLTRSFPHHSFLALQNTRQNFSTTLWSHFQGAKSPTKSTKNVKRMELNRFWEGHSFIGWELKQKAKHCLVGPQLGACMSSSSKFFVTLPMSANDHKSSSSIDFVQQTWASRQIHKYGVCKYSRSVLFAFSQSSDYKRASFLECQG